LVGAAMSDSLMMDAEGDALFLFNYYYLYYLLIFIKFCVHVILPT
jgi:hypothetical protein